MPRFDKLIRDKIPQRLQEKGVEHTTHVANDEEYRGMLVQKLKEEVREFEADQNPEELADILEVIYALAESRGISRQELEAMRAKKESERGAFREHIILEEAAED